MADIVGEGRILGEGVVAGMVGAAARRPSLLTVAVEAEVAVVGTLTEAEEVASAGGACSLQRAGRV